MRVFNLGYPYLLPGTTPEGCVSLYPSYLPVEDPEFSMLSAIDPYGYTAFNYLQMTQFLIEWRQLMERRRMPEDVLIGYRAVESLALRCQGERCLLFFEGD